MHDFFASLAREIRLLLALTRGRKERVAWLLLPSIEKGEEHEICKLAPLPREKGRVW